MLDSVNIEIEELALKNDGSYIDAIIEFSEKKGINDVEDVLEMLHPIVYEKVKSEFIEKNYIKDKPRNKSLDKFFAL